MFKKGDNVRIKPEIETYGLMKQYVGATGTIKEIKTICSGKYEIADVEVVTSKRKKVIPVQTKNIEII